MTKVNTNENKLFQSSCTSFTDHEEFRTLICPECIQENSLDSLYCRFCGHQIASDENNVIPMRKAKKVARLKKSSSAKDQKIMQDTLSLLVTNLETSNQSSTNVIVQSILLTLANWEIALAEHQHSNAMMKQEIESYKRLFKVHH